MRYSVLHGLQVLRKKSFERSPRCVEITMARSRYGVNFTRSLEGAGETRVHKSALMYCNELSDAVKNEDADVVNGAIVYPPIPVFRYRFAT
jgi:hypothetical protein